ncbi:hypothetical protein ACA910_014326 [Epithemia clementina (nom. ined.)]
MFASWPIRKLPSLHSTRLHGQSGKAVLWQPCLWSSFRGQLKNDSTAVCCDWNMEQGSFPVAMLRFLLLSLANDFDFTHNASFDQRKIKLKASTLSRSDGVILSTLTVQSYQSHAQLQQRRCISSTTICFLAVKGNKSETPKKALEEQRNEQWLDMYENLKLYKEKHGHCMVPVKEVPLGRWVASHRSQYKKSQSSEGRAMSSDRILLLDDIGFVWDVKDFQWTRNFEALKDKFLDSKRFPDGENDENVKLKRWIENQWAKYQQFDSEGGASCMTQERFDRLKRWALPNTCWRRTGCIHMRK